MACQSLMHYSHLRENLAEIWDQATAHLLRSPKNAQRLLEAIARAVQGEAEAIDAY